MKRKLQKTEIKRVLSEEIEVEIPEKQLYFWHNGERVAYCVTPEWTTWRKEHGSPEEIWQFRVVKVDPSNKKIEAFYIRVSELAEIFQDRGNTKYLRLVENLLLYPEEDNRTKEEFMKDYEDVLREINSYLYVAES